MKELKIILQESKESNKFTIIHANDVSVLLFEGKTIMAGCQSDFHCGHEEAYFNKKLIKKNWNGAEHLQLLCEKMLPNKTKAQCIIHNVNNDIFEFLDKN